MLPILSGVMSLGQTWLEGRQKKAQVRAEAEATVMKEAAKSQSSWEALHAKGSQTSWKDEFWTIVLAIPMMCAFIPDLVPTVMAGFQVLDSMPDWYRWFLGIAIGASFGVRAIPKILSK